MALCVFCCLLVSWLGFLFREGEHKKHSAWKAWPVSTCIISFSELEEANGDLLSSFVFLLCISAQEKDIHACSLQSQGCRVLENRISTSCPSWLRWLRHNSPLQFMSSRGFHLLRDGFALLRPNSLPLPLVYFCTAVLQTQTEQLLVCCFCCPSSFLPILTLYPVQPWCIPPVTSPSTSLARGSAGGWPGVSGAELMPLRCS